MRYAKEVLLHNINTFCYIISLQYQLYRNDIATKTELLSGILNCIKESFRLPYWKLSYIYCGKTNLR